MMRTSTIRPLVTRAPQGDTAYVRRRTLLTALGLSRVRAVILGQPYPGSWKWDLEQAARRLRWDVTHLRASKATADDVVRACHGADLLIWARTYGHDPAGDLAAMLRRIEDAGTATVGLHLDIYWSVRHREPAIGRHPWWTCQWVFTADGGERDWASRGVNHRWCPPAAGRRWLEPCQPRRDWPHRIVFVGRVEGHTRSRHRDQLVAWAQAQFGDEFGHYGQTPETRVAGHDLCGLYRSAEVVLGDSARADYYWSDRVPLTLIRGGLLTHPRTRGMRSQGFTDDTMLLYRRGDLDDLGMRIKNLSPRRRAEMAEAGRQVVIDRHLWEHRLQAIARDAL